MCSRWPLPGRDLTVDEWNTSALESPKKRTQQHWIFIYCFFSFCAINMESRGTRHERIRSCCRLSGDWFFCAASELDKLNYTNNPKLSSDDRASACERFVYSCFLCLFTSIWTPAAPSSHTQQWRAWNTSRKWLVRSSRSYLEWNLLKSCRGKSEAFSKGLILEPGRIDASRVLSNRMFLPYLPCKQNKTTKKKKSKLCFLLGRLWSLLSPVCEDRTATLAG